MNNIYKQRKADEVSRNKRVSKSIHAVLREVSREKQQRSI